MSSTKALGPDGFGGPFYQKYWKIIAVDIFNSMFEFFH